MSENKTKPTTESVAEYIASRANEQQHADCRTLMAMLKRITRTTPKMWGPSIVGYGMYRYIYESGRSGEAPLVGFAIRGRELVVYLYAEDDEQQALLAQLGPHRMTKACLYIKRLTDLDLSVLERLVVNSIADLRRRYGADNTSKEK